MTSESASIQKPGLHKFLALGFAILVFNLVFYTRGIPLPGTFGFVTLVFSGHLFATLAFLPSLIKTHPSLQLAPLQRGYKTTINSKHLWPFVGITGLILLSLTLSLLRASWFDRLLLSGFSLGLTGLNLYLLTKRDPSIKALSELFIFPVNLALRYLPGLGNAIVSMISIIPLLKNNQLLKQKIGGKHTNTATILRGAILTSIIVFIMLTLLASDAAFLKFLETLFNFNINITWPQRLFATAIVTSILTPIAFFRERTTFVSPLASPENRRFSTEAFMVVSAVLVIISTFLIIQAPYLFASVGQERLANIGITTYSEYVRRGFQELILVSALIYGVTGGAYLVIRSRILEKDWLKWLTITLLSVDLLFVTSIVRRVWLYAQFHGLTLARFYGLIFLFAIVSWTLTLIGRLTFPRRFIWHYFEATVIIITLFAAPILNPEELTVWLAPPTVNGELDYTYMARQGADGIQGWIKAYEHVDNWFDQHPTVLDSYEISEEELRQLRYHQQILNQLMNDYRIFIFTYGTDADIENWSQINDWSEKTGHNTHVRQYQTYYTNLGEQAAYTWMKAEIPYDELQPLSQKLNNYMNGLYQHRTTPLPDLDRSTDSPLVGS